MCENLLYATLVGTSATLIRVHIESFLGIHNVVYLDV